VSDPSHDDYRRDVRRYGGVEHQAKRALPALAPLGTDAD
jgi:hypothetical protein